MVIKKVFVFLGTVLFSFPLFAGPQSFSLQGQIVKPDGEKLEAASVSFQVQIYSPLPDNCLVYEETFPGVNMSGSKGLFDLAVGTGTRAGGDYEDVSTFSSVFNNSGAAVTPTTCLAGGPNYTPSATDQRLLRLSFDDGSGPVTLAQDHVIRSAPFAQQAGAVQGLGASDLIQVKTGTAQLTQADLETIFATPTDITELRALIDGTSSDYLVSSPAAPVGFNNQRVTDVATPTAGTDATNKNYVDANLGGNTISTGALGAGETGEVLTWNGTQWESQSLSAAGDVNNNGNTFAGLMTLGTNDNFGLNLETNGTAAISIDNTQGVSLAAGLGVTGGVNTGGNVNLLAESELRLEDAADGEYIGFKAPSTVTASQTFTLPDGDGAANQVLATDGSGQLIWATDANSGGTGDFLAAGTVAMTGNLRLNDNYLSNDGGSEGIRIDNDGLVGIGAAPTASRELFVWGTAEVSQTGQSALLAERRENSNTVEAVASFDRNRGDATAPGIGFGGNLEFQLEGSVDGTDPKTNELVWGWENAQTNATTDRDSFMAFDTMLDNTVSEKLRITSGGNLGVGTSAPETKLDVEGRITSGPIDATGGNTGSIVMKELLASGQNTVGLRAPDTLATDLLWTLPSALGTANQVLRNSATPGLLEWTTITPGTGDVINGGNAFGGLMILGTNDNFGMVLETNNTSAINIDNLQGVTLSAGLSVADGISAGGNLNLLTESEIRLEDAADGEFIGFKAPATLTASQTFTLPDGDGSIGEFIQTNGSGVLSWAAPSAGDHDGLGGLTDDDHTQYALLAGRSGGQALIGGSDASDDLTLESSSNATKGYVLINPNGGNVGIGTATPNSILALNRSQNSQSEVRVSNLNTGSGAKANFAATSNAGTFQFGINSLTGGSDAYITNVANSDIFFATNNQIEMTIKAGGDVGIGTSGPGTKLDVEGRITAGPIDGTAGNTGSIIFEDSLADNYSGIRAADDTTADYLLTLPATAGAANQVLSNTATPGVLAWTTPNTGAGDFESDGSVAMTGDLNLEDQALLGGTGVGDDLTLQSTSNATKGDILLNPDGGNVGIGTDTPERQLTIFTSSNAVDFKILADTGNNAIIQLQGDAGANYIGVDNANNNLTLGGTTDAVGASSVTMAVENNDGNVGIGTETPASKLHLYQNTGTINGTVGLTLENDGIGDALSQYVLSGGQRWVTGIDNSDGDKFKIASSLELGSDDRLTIDPTSGNVGVGASDPGTRLDVAGRITARPIDATAGNTGSIVLRELAATGTNTVGLRAPDLLATDLLWTLPDSLGSANQVLRNSATPGLLEWSTPSAGVTAHSGLTGLTGSDDHTQYALLAGRSGGQALIGGSDASDDLTLESSSNATKGDVLINPNGGNVGIGSATPSNLLTIEKTVVGNTGETLVFNNFTLNPAVAGQDFDGHTTFLQTSGAVNDLGDIVGVTSEVANTSFGVTVDNLSGAEFWGTGAFGGAINSIYGAKATASTGNASTSEVAGVKASARNINGSSISINSFSGLNASANNGGVSGTPIVNGYGVYSIYSQSNAANTTSGYGGYFSVEKTGGSGTIGTGYGVFVGDIDGATQYGLYQSGSDDTNYFAGNVGIGTTAPGTKLDVEGRITAGPIDGTSGNTGSIIFEDSNADFYSGIRAADTTTASYFLTLPATAGAANQVLSNTATPGVLAWTTPNSTAGFFVDGGNTSGGTLVLGSNDTENLQLETDGTTALTIDTNQNIGVGQVSAPETIFHIQGDDTTPRLRVENRDSDGTGNNFPGFEAYNYMGATNFSGFPVLSLRNSRGNTTTSSAIQSGDKLGTLEFQGVYNAADSDHTTANIKAVAAENFSGTNAGTHLTFETTDLAATSASEKLRITSAGNVGMGTTAPGTKLDVEGRITAGPIDGTSGNTGSVVLEELAGTGGNTVGLRAPDAIAADLMWTLPATLGTANQVLRNSATPGLLEWATDADTSDHGGLGGLLDDDHTQYARLGGRVGGQTFVGGANASEDLILQSTLNATKGDVLINPDGGNVGIGSSTPGSILAIEEAFAPAASNKLLGLLTTVTGSSASYNATFGINSYMSIESTGVGVAEGYAANFVSVTGNDAKDQTAFGVDSVMSTHTTDTGYGFRAVSNADSTGGTQYGFYSNMDDADLDTRWGFYQASATANNYFAGSIGIGTTVPDELLHVYSAGGGEKLKLEAGNSSSVMARLENTSQAWEFGMLADENFTLRDATNADTLVMQVEEGAPANTLFLQSSGNVGIGSATPRAQLDVVGGSIVGTPAVTNATATIDFGTGNIQFTADDCGAFNLHNLKDGGTYTFVVKGAGVGTCAFTAFSDAGTTGLTEHLPPDHAATTATTHTIYTAMVVGADVYFSWVPGY